MTRDEVLAMAEQAGFSIDYARTIPSVYGDAECVKHLVSLAFEAGRKAADQDRVDAERYRWIKENSMAECINCVTPWKCNGPHVTGGDALDEQIDRARSAK